MNLDALYTELTLKTNAKLVLLVLDGVGDLATREQGYLTPLEAAATPNLDALSKDSAQGRMIPVAPGITPGSGPGHVALFGYDPVEHQVGRGVIEALGLGLELKAGDVAARANFCTLDAKGIVTDRRAGRIDTKVCEEQTHYLGEEGERLPKEIRRIVISRDTPFAQNRFAKEARLTNLQYLSDYKEGGFGRATGLLMEGSMLLARSVVLADKKGIVRYIQVVPEITRLPDMEAAFRKAAELAKET